MDDVQTGGPPVVDRQWLSCVVQGDMTEQGELLRLDVFTVWKNKKDERSLRSLKSQTRHVLLYERHVLFCKKKEDSASNSNKSVVYVLKNSLPVS